MAEPDSFAPPFSPPKGEPSSILEMPATSGRSFEFSCRGDRVPLSVLAPEASSSGAVLIVAPGPGPGQETSRARWLEAGIAVASIELPLLGSRHSAKLSEKLADGSSEILRTEFIRQAVMELRRSIDVLEEIGIRKPGAPVAFAGAGIAASLGAIACATDERFVAAVLGTDTDFGVDASQYVSQIAPRPVLRLEREERDVLGACWAFLSPILA